MLNDSEVRALVASAKSGSKSAFGELYDTYFAPIYRYVLFKIRHKESAEDITQDTFLRAFNSLSRFEERGVPFRAWLYQIAGNACIDWYKKKRDITLSDDLATQIDFDLPDESEYSNANSLALTRERAGAIITALDKLDESEREVIELRYMEGMSYAEIAKITERSEEALRASAYRSKKVLRKILKRYYENDNDDKDK